MSSALTHNARLVNEGHEFDADLLLDHGRIVKYVSLRSRNGEGWGQMSVHQVCGRLGLETNAN